MAGTCTSCGKKISLFSGNSPDLFRIKEAKRRGVYEDGLCKFCLNDRIQEYDKVHPPKDTVVFDPEGQNLDIDVEPLLSKVFVSAEPPPVGFEDLGFVSGYCILGTGPLSQLLSTFTDFFGEESNAYLEKAKRAEAIAMRNMKIEAILRGGYRICSCRVSLTEATSGQGMLMSSVSGTAARGPDALTEEDAETIRKMKEILSRR